MAQVTITIQVVGDTGDVSQAVKALGGHLAELSVIAPTEQPAETDARELVSAMRAELTDGGRAVIKAMARLSLENDGPATSSAVREALGDITPSGLAGRLVSVTAFSARHGVNKPYSTRWTGREQEYRVEPSLARLIVEEL